MLRKITMKERKEINRIKAIEDAERMELLHQMDIDTKNRIHGYWQPEDIEPEGLEDEADLDHQDSMCEIGKELNRGSYSGFVII